jgi:hypothetical protein
MKAWRYFIALALVATGGAGAQLAPAAHEVLLLAPEFHVFAGSAANFESLAGGLRVGFPIMLSTLAADGTREIVEFMPAQPLSAAETVRVMVSADPDKRLVFSLRSFAGSPGTRRDKLTFTPPGVPLCADETKQALQLAAELLASQGIQDPTPEQLRAALIGGAVATPSGAKVLLRGVLEKGRQS